MQKINCSDPATDLSAAVEGEENTTSDERQSLLSDQLSRASSAHTVALKSLENIDQKTPEAADTAITTTANYCSRRPWITTEKLNELRKQAQEAVKKNMTFTIRGCFSSVRNALNTRGWVEKLDVHRKQIPSGVCQVSYEDLAQGLPKRKTCESRRQYVLKCERNIMSRFLEHMPIDFLWTTLRKEKCDYIDQAINPCMIVNKFQRAPFTSKEGLCSQLKDFHWFYEEGTSELYFPRCYNIWSPEDLSEFVDNFKMTACISFVRRLVDKFKEGGFDSVFSPSGKVPFTSIEFAFKRCSDFLDTCQHNDIDVEDTNRICDHDWEMFLNQQHQMSNEEGRILSDRHRLVEGIIQNGALLLTNVQQYWPQYSSDGYQNLWIVKPANKCRGRGIILVDNLKKILAIVNTSVTSKSRYVVQKYIERPLTIHNTKFDIRQWFLITNIQPLVVWMYKESYLRFSSQEYNLSNHHESVHLTNHAIQKKYTNGKRDKRLPNENMWDCYSFQAYLRQIGKHDMWTDRIFPGMRKAIVGTMLASQDNMDRRANTFELFGADFMICEDFYPWLIEINSSPDLGATTSVTARMCPQCLEDVIKVVVDRKTNSNADSGNFQLIYSQVVPATPAYMGLNLFVKGKQLMPKSNHQKYSHQYRVARSRSSSSILKRRTTALSSPPTLSVQKAMQSFNATEYIQKYLYETKNKENNRVGKTHSAKVKLFIPSTSPINGSNRLTSKTVRTVIDSTQQHHSYLSSKRHQSCGPGIPNQLYTVCDKGRNNFKFIIRNCMLQSNLCDDNCATMSATTSQAPASANEKQYMLELISNRNITKANRLSIHSSKRQKPSSPLIRTKGASFRASTACPAVDQAKQNKRDAAFCGGRLTLDKKRRGLRTAASKTFNLKKDRVDDPIATIQTSSTSINAIGKSILTWKSSSKNLLSPVKTNAASVVTNQMTKSCSCKSVPNCVTRQKS